MVALTFDDGPDAAATPRILDVLAERGVVATFFVFGVHALEHPELIARAVQAGHAVQPHCWSGHRSHHELDRVALEDDVGRTVAALASLGCPAPTMWRPPYGDIRDPLSYEVAAAHRLRLVAWTLETCDWHEAHSADRILTDIETGTREDAILGPDSVVLMHDKPKTCRLLPALLDLIERRGYEVGLLAPDSPAAALGGDYRWGRRDGKAPCGASPARR